MMVYHWHGKDSSDKHVIDVYLCFKLPYNLKERKTYRYTVFLSYVSRILFTKTWAFFFSFLIFQ